ncbi:MAG: ABC transporter permease subunit [Rhodobacteraceae bacterium]|nr:ABC transporter permease subunit [Paracoccaceae bacterium]
MRTESRLSVVPALTILLLLGPIAAGLVGTVLPAFGLMKVGGGGSFSLEPWHMLFAEPGLFQAAWISVKTGLLSTLGALVGCLLLVAGWQGTRTFSALERLLSPLLSVPHAAAALGLAFLLAPSGWAARLNSPWLTGWERPPDLLIVGDPGGWALIAGLMAKELPFLMLMALAALPQINSRERMQVVLSLGYGRVRGWVLVVLPALYSQLRLPVYAVLAYSMSNVDVSTVLGPTAPPTLAVLILRWMTDADLALRGIGAAGALLQLAIVVGGIALWRLGEIAAAALARRAVESGQRSAGWRDQTGRVLGIVIAVLAGVSILAGLASQAVWSFAGRWRFPDVLPAQFGLRSWERHGESALDVTLVTLGLAALAAIIALFFVLGCLEAEHRRGRSMGRAGLLLLYLPLILPQIAFLPGLQILLLQLGAAQGFLPVLATHIVFVLPYMFLALSGPFHAWDTRYATVAAGLGTGPEGVLWRLRLPMLLAPILTVTAVGMAVSVGQYLPTLLAGGGRLTTLTTEALALSSGGDRRAIGVWTLALTAAAWVPFAAALVVPRLVYRKRQAMLHG